jgi:hypothetical protein
MMPAFSITNESLTPVHSPLAKGWPLHDSSAWTVVRGISISSARVNCRGFGTDPPTLIFQSKSVRKLDSWLKTVVTKKPDSTSTAAIAAISVMISFFIQFPLRLMAQTQLYNLRHINKAFPRRPAKTKKQKNYLPPAKITG